MQRQYRAYVFILRRWPKGWYDNLLAAAVSKATRSPDVHVAVGDGVGLVSAARGPHCQIESQERFEIARQGHGTAYAVPCRRLPRLYRCEPFKRVNIPLTAWSWATRTPCIHNCVGLSRMLLRTSGVATPDSIITPADFRRWLDEQGFDRAEL